MKTSFLYTDSHLEEFPTLLHCAARFGLKNLAALLLKCPEAMWACRIANTHGDDPASLAEKHGHKELRKLIKELSVSSYAFSYTINKQGTVMFLLLSNTLSSLVKPTTSRSFCLKILLCSCCLRKRGQDGVLPLCLYCFNGGKCFCVA